VYGKSTLNRLFRLIADARRRKSRDHEKDSPLPSRVIQLFSGSLAELWSPPSNQISFLDGLRSIAILLVINLHFSAEFSSIHGDNFYSRLPFVINGWVGVDLFFVLSGFFIGGQLHIASRTSDLASLFLHIFMRLRDLLAWSGRKGIWLGGFSISCELLQRGDRAGWLVAFYRGAVLYSNSPFALLLCSEA